jgi:hypothetical protein
MLTTLGVISRTSGASVGALPVANSGIRAKAGPDRITTSAASVSCPATAIAPRRHGCMQDRIAALKTVPTASEGPSARAASQAQGL